MYSIGLGKTYKQKGYLNGPTNRGGGVLEAKGLNHYKENIVFILISDQNLLTH